MSRLCKSVFVFGLLSLFLAGCTSSRYKMANDTAPAGDFDASKVPDAVPVWEPLSRQGNKSPYRVRGKTYKVLPTAQNYQAEGIASWYGLKFHGELTSNGEVYNMYELTAAHKTLPLPTFLKVTNLENGREIVVRVNDRGPFHSKRVIDLSYAAAKKLGFQKKGTARVRLEAINIASPEIDPKSVDDGLDSDYDKLATFVQVAAFSSESAVRKLRGQVESILAEVGIEDRKLFIAKSPDRDPPVYRLRLGPFDNDMEANKLVSLMHENGQKGALLITRSIKGKAL